MPLSRRAFLSATATALASAQPRPGPKIFVLWDMEGTSGLFTREQAWYWEAGVREGVAGQARELFTSDANSQIGRAHV